ncbi:MAG: restriction endonuclease [Gammaproteobacteria bacterium AqS3]|nr:restriction endonuclease [Gammaproteobacteria bacterium AqS3]
MMSASRKIREAQQILESVGIPIEEMTARRKKRVAMSLLAIANLTPKKPWSEAEIWSGKESHILTTRQIIRFWNEHYGEKLSSGSYDDVRRKDLIYLVEAGIALRSAGNPDASTNSPMRAYAISPDAAGLLRQFGESGWPEIAARFIDEKGSLKRRMERDRQKAKVSVVQPNGEIVMLAPGIHNEIQKAIIEEFLPRFVPGAEILYVGDAINKSLVLKKERLEELGFFELAHDALPDVVAYDRNRSWIILVEAVYSSNPISPLRHLMLERMTKNCTAPRVYVSAFKDRKSLREWLLEISWETEVWLADTPEHLIHFNGDRFLGPYNDRDIQ